MANADMHWQVQQVKQRLSEVLRAAERDGPQYVTRHGKDVAVIVDIEHFRHLRGSDEPTAAPKSMLDVLSAGPDIGLTNEEVDALFARDRRTTSTREIPFAGPDWE